MTKIDDILMDVRNQLGTEFISTEIVGMDGLAIAGTSMDPKFDSSVISARLAMVMKLSEKVSEKMSIGTVEDSLATTENTFILARFLGDGSYYWHISVSKDATLGIIRMLMTEYADQLWDSIPH